MTRAWSKAIAGKVQYLEYLFRALYPTVKNTPGGLRGNTIRKKDTALSYSLKNEQTEAHVQPCLKRRGRLCYSINRDILIVAGIVVQ